MGSRTLKWVKRGAVVLAVSVITLLGVRIFDVQRGPPLELWHTFVPHELSADEIDKSDWKQYMAAEEQAFAEVRTEVTDRLSSEARDESNRYDATSPIYPGKFATDWKVMMGASSPILPSEAWLAICC